MRKNKKSQYVYVLGNNVNNQISILQFCDNDIIHEYPTRGAKKIHYAKYVPTAFYWTNIVLFHKFSATSASENGLSPSFLISDLTAVVPCALILRMFYYVRKLVHATDEVTYGKIVPAIPNYGFNFNCIINGARDCIRSKCFLRTKEKRKTF